MLLYRALHTPICASCRLRASIAAKQLARSRNSFLQHPLRPLSTTRRLSQHVDENPKDGFSTVQPGSESVVLSPEQAALQARQTFGDSLPEGTLSEEEYRVYERMYGRPLELREEAEIAEEGLEGVIEGGDVGTGVLKETEDGALEEVEFDVDEAVEDAAETAELKDGLETSDADATLAQDIQASLVGETTETAEAGEQDEGEAPQRVHPLTLANRFSTSPSTLYLPKHTVVDAIETQLSGISNVHIKEAAHRVFGGVGLPYSTSTPAIGKTMQQKPIGLDAAQSHMSEIEGDAFLAALVPGIYASVMSVLVETRKRLGSAWAESLVDKANKNELRILDAGGAGGGVLAVREMLRAEWERMHEENNELGSGMALAEADGKAGGAGVSPPLGHATALTGSDVLRRRASRLLENTTFVPRLPNYVHTEEAKKKGKFDIIIAPHTLWPLREDYLRKTHMQNLWSMLSQDGGVMLLLEKGVPRGFELVAAAREMLLESHIASPASMSRSVNIDEPIDLNVNTSSLDQQKDKGMIIAPCTNHESCPMYKPQGMVKGRRDICHFSQRYIRPPFLQTILSAKGKNYEDVDFSYLSVMRGRDLREEKGVAQDPQAAELAFEGYEGGQYETLQVNSLSLPRAVLPPLKRQGHVILDLCTPAGTLERWTVPRSFSKQAFRDARKSSWGDLWALGAKTRVPRIPKIKKRKSTADFDIEGTSVKSERTVEWDVDAYGRIVAPRQNSEQPAKKNEGGRMRNGRKVKGIRDKRDKKGSGNGRKKNDEEE